MNLRPEENRQVLASSHCHVPIFEFREEKTLQKSRFLKEIDDVSA